LQVCYMWALSHSGARGGYWPHGRGRRRAIKRAAEAQGGTRMRLAAWIIGAVACAVVASSPVHAQDYPTRPIRVIVGFGAGSGADITARVVGARMSEILGQQIIVENKTGGGSQIGA